MVALGVAAPIPPDRMDIGKALNPAPTMLGLCIAGFLSMLRIDGRKARSRFSR
jgi:hypothetical protein